MRRENGSAKRIAIVVAHFDPQVDYLETTLANVLSNGNLVEVITSTRPACTLSDVAAGFPNFPIGHMRTGSINVYRLKTMLAQGQRVISRGVIPQLKVINPDLIIQIVPTQFFSVPATRYTRKTGTPLIYISGENSQQGAYSGLIGFIKSIYSKVIRDPIIRYSTRYAVTNFATTEETAEIIGAVNPNAKVTLTPLPFRSDKFYYCERTRANFRSKLGYSEEHVSLFIGRFDPAKNLVRILNEWESYAASNPKSCILFVGESDKNLSYKLRQSAASSEFHHRIRILPFTTPEDVNSFLNAADVSIWPTVSVGIQQAMATGNYVLTAHDSPGAFLVQGPAKDLGNVYGSNSLSLEASLSQTRGLDDTEKRLYRSKIAFELYSDQSYAKNFIDNVRCCTQTGDFEK